MKRKEISLILRFLNNEGYIQFIYSVEDCIKELETIIEVEQ